MNWRVRAQRLSAKLSGRRCCWPTLKGKAPTQIQRALGVSRPTIYKCIDKALATGVVTGLHDRFHRAYAPQISEAAKMWVVELACRKPKDLGLAAELWTISAFG